jgi:hypothetical protein
MNTEQNDPVATLTALADETALNDMLYDFNDHGFEPTVIGFDRFGRAFLAYGYASGGAGCGGTFAKVWTDEEARAEYQQTFADIPADEPIEVVCENCYQQIMAWAERTGQLR